MGDSISRESIQKTLKLFDEYKLKHAGSNEENHRLTPIIAAHKVKQFGLYHSIGDLPRSQLTVESFEMAISALERMDKIRKIIEKWSETLNNPKPHDDPNEHTALYFLDVVKIMIAEEESIRCKEEYTEKRPLRTDFIEDGAVERKITTAAGHVTSKETEKDSEDS